MKRSEMTIKIFNRNQAWKLGEALEELTDLQLAYCVEEATGGAPAQRWFAKCV